MSRLSQIVLIAVIVLLAVAAGVLFGRYQKARADYRALRVSEETARTQYAEAFNAIAEIQESLGAVPLGDTTVRMLSSAVRNEQQPSQAHRRDALERIAAIDATLQRNKQRIHDLETNLEKSGVKIAGLGKMIDGLKRQVATKEAIVDRLTGRVDTLQTQVAGLQSTVQRNRDTLRVRDLTIEQKRQDLATIYYLVGSKRQLTDAGVIVAKGGLFGLGRTLLQSGRYDERLFTPLDTDRERLVRTAAANVEVLSPQPASSYALQMVDGHMELHILDPQQFRKAKHLVIMTR